MWSVPVIVTVVAFVSSMVNVDEAPGVIEAGVALNWREGAGLEATVTVAVFETVPPGPVAVTL